MKRIIYLTAISLGFLFSTISIFGQEINKQIEEQRQANKKIEERINQAALASLTSGDLRNKLNSGDKNIILKIDTKADPSVIPLLKLYADHGLSRMIFSKQQLIESPWIVEYYQQQNGDADVALAKAGEVEYFNRIIKQTNVIKNIRIREEAVRKLFLIGSKEAYKRIYELLDDNYVAASNDSDSQELPISEYIMNYLSETVTDPPNLQKVYETNQRIQLWKKWFEKHKELIGDIETPKPQVKETSAIDLIYENFQLWTIGEAETTKYIG